MRAGEWALLPRADATGPGGLRASGVAVTAALDPAGPVSLSGSVLRAERAGATQLVYTAGPFRTAISIEVSP